MRYVVVESFSDMQDGGFTYKPGDAFPRGGVSVGQNRLLELSTAHNKLGRALIKEQDDAVTVPESKAKAVAESAGIGGEPNPPQGPVEEKPKSKRRNKKE